MKIRGYNITFKSVFNIGFGIVERLLSFRYFNIWKTLYINFRLLPFGQAVKFPIVVWGGVKICSLMGKIIIKAPVRFRMIELGSRIHNEFVCVNKSRLFIDGKLVFLGQNRFMNGYQISVQKNATLTLGVDCYLGENVSIITFSDITIGSSNRIAYNSVIMDTDMHYSINTLQRTVGRNCNPIHLGCSNWIGNGTRIMKGTITPDWTIVTAGSFLNKDYTKSIPEQSIIGGSPAKLIKEGQCRIFSLKNEEYLNRYFAANSELRAFVLPDKIDLIEFCRR